MNEKNEDNKIYRGIVYSYVSPSGKYYIGQTYNERDRRSRFFCLTGSYGGIKIDRAREKYGPENFKYEILFEIKTTDKELLMNELNDKEIYFIQNMILLEMVIIF